MKPWVAYLVLAGLAALNVGVFLVGPWPLVAVAAVGLAVVPTGRRGLVLFAASTITIYTLLLAWLAPGPDTVALGPIRLGLQGAFDGAMGGTRLATIVIVNLAVLGRARPARLLDGLRLPGLATGFLAAVLIAGQDLGRDFARLRDARRLDGDWPAGRIRRAVAAAALLPALLVAADRRAGVRRDALRCAGVDTGPTFAPLVAVTALAVAGRLALVALPNVSLVYVIVFAGGLAAGPRVGFWAGFWSMALTDFLLTGFLPTGYVNVPAMALVGFAGGWLGRTNWLDGAAGTAVAASAGIIATLAFSVAADTMTWVLLPELRGDWLLWRAVVLAGLAFNALPAITNAVLFAAAAGPVQQAFRALRSAPTSPTSPATPQPLPPTGQA